MAEEQTGHISGSAIWSRLGVLRQLLDAAELTLDTTRFLGPADAAAHRAEYLAKLQRVSGWALRDAVTDALQYGMPWRELVEPCQMPLATLHRQYKAGGRIIVREDLAQELSWPDIYELFSPESGEHSES